jgi:dienelactone hydrolase
VAVSKLKEKPMHQSRYLVVWACVGLLAFACLSCSLDGPAAVADVEATSRGVKASAAPDPGAVGPYAIGHTSFMLHDPERPTLTGAPRPIPVEVFYPADPSADMASWPEAVYALDPIRGVWPETLSSEWERHGLDRAYEEPEPSKASPFPLVIFSPGWGGPIWGYHFIVARIASHGFVVAVMYHYGDCFFPGEQFDHIAMASLNRPLDSSLVLDRLLERNATSGDLLEGLIMPDRIAASGHSLGGFSAMALVAGVDNVGDFFGTPAGNFMGDPPEASLVRVDPDPRIKAIVPFDGSNQLLLFQELARVKVPSIGIGQEWSTLALDPAWASWQARQHAAFGGHPNYRVDVTHAIHPSFTGGIAGFGVALDRGLVSQAIYDARYALFNPAELPEGEVPRLAAKYAISFLQTVLAGTPGYRDILTPGHALRREQYIEFFVTEKRSPNSIDEDWPDEFIYFKHQPGSEQAKGERNPHTVMDIPHMGLPR